VRLILFADHVQHRDQHDGDRTGEVQSLLRLSQDGVQITKVGIDVGSRALAAARQQRSRVREHDGVVVDVDHAAVGRLRLRDLVRVVRARYSGADVEELPDAGLFDQVLDRAGEECPVGAHRGDQIGVRLDRRVAGRAVGRVVVLAAKPVVVDPGDVGDAGVEGWVLALICALITHFACHCGKPSCAGLGCWLLAVTSG